MSAPETERPVSAHLDPLVDRLEHALGPEFRVLRAIGEGAMARVYLASETALERLVAVKVLRPEFVGDETASRRFLREARAAARLAHPGVVRIHRVGEMDDGLPFIVMEYFEGRALTDVLAAESPLSLERARRILAQIAAALAAAHAKGVIHRDVRPGNVLVESGTERIALVDFGIAGIKETGSEVVTRLTRTGESLGDPRYASPEQLLGEPVTEATDVYSFGVLAYEVLTGAGPYPAGTDRERVAAHLQQVPRPLAELRPGLPAELLLMEKCLAKRPEQRPRAERLAPALDGSTAAAGPDYETEAPFFPALAAFLDELRRRRVYRVAVAYLAAVFILLQGADLVLPVLATPGWVYPAIVAVSLAGFPVVLVLSWIFDVTRSGIRRTPAPDSATALPADRMLRNTLKVAGLLASVAAAALAGRWLLG
jgi:tRNA A-37 threonylcarbamoyl transferase component Bud32